MKRCWIAGWVLCLSLATSYSADNLWTGATSTDWNDGTNWALGGVPDTSFGDNAVVSTTTPNIATITADISSTPNHINVTGGGRIDHRAGTAGTSNGAVMYVGQDSMTSFYNLADTSATGLGISGFAQGTGSLNATGNLLVGAWGDNRNGTINVNTTGTFAVSGELFFGDSTGSQGALNLESGAMTVNNKIYVGNNNGTGTLTMSGGTLTKTGGEDTFVGSNSGTGTLTQSGGTIALNHNLYVGQGGGGNGTLNLSGSAVLNTGRDFVIGREGGTGSLNVTGGTITKTGDEKMIVGHNNGTGTVVHSGGTINVNQNQLYIGNENTNARGTYTLSGTGALTVSNEVVVGRESGTGILNVNGGTITTSGNGNMYIGSRNGTGTLNQTAGVIIVSKEFGVGVRDDIYSGTGTYNLSGGSLSAVNDIFIGKDQGSSGTMIMTDGTISTSSTFRIGHNQATGVVTQSGGTVNVQNEVFVGNENSASSVGTYTLSGAGVLNVGNEVIVGRDNGAGTFNLNGGTVNVGNEVQVGRDNGTGTFNLNGGTVNANKISGGTGSATVNFNGGVLKAKRDEINLIEGLDSANIQSGGIKINSNGFNVATSQALTGTGGLEKLGTGNLILSGNNTYTGNTTVSGGTLSIGNNSSSTFAGSSTITINSGAQLNLPNAATNIVGTLILGPQTYTSGTFNSSNSGGLITGSGTIQVGAALEPSYSDWASENAPTGTSADDYDGDGVSNGLEYVLGGDKNTNDYGKMPKVTVTGGNMIFTFERSQASINAKTDVDILVGTDLVAWPSVYTVGADTAGSTSGVTITKDSPVAGKDTVSLDVTMSSDPKKFARLRVITK